MTLPYRHQSITAAGPRAQGGELYLKAICFLEYIFFFHFLSCMYTCTCRFCLTCTCTCMRYTWSYVYTSLHMYLYLLSLSPTLSLFLSHSLTHSLTGSLKFLLRLIPNQMIQLHSDVEVLQGTWVLDVITHQLPLAMAHHLLLDPYGERVPLLWSTMNK